MSLTLEEENERLRAHHTSCKDEIGHLTELAEKWRIRAYFAEKLIYYFNDLNPWLTTDQIKTELDLQTKGAFEKWQRREAWM